MSEIDPSDPDAVRRQLDGLHAEFAGLGSGSGLLRGAVSVFRELFGLARTLSAHIGTLSVLVGSLQDKLTEEVAKNSALRDQIARYERQQYGRRSEKRRHTASASEGGACDDAVTPDAGEDGPEAEKTTEETLKKTAEKKAHGGVNGRKKDRGDAVNDAGLRFGPEATVIDIDVMPPEIEGLAADAFAFIGERVCCKLASVPIRHVVLRYHYKKAKIMSSGTLVCAPAVEGVFKNSCADVTFIAGMLVDKFAWHLPLYRQHQMLAESGITINRGSLSGWANRAISLLEPVFEAQCRSVLDSAVIVMDETPIRAGRDPDKPGKMKKCYYWPVLGDRDEVVFPFAPSRAYHHVKQFLGDFEGTLVTDGYGAYGAYAETRGDAVKQQNCWTHTRRKFEEQLDKYPVLVKEPLDLIGRMYKIEKEFRSQPPSELLVARCTHTRPLVNAFWLWCEQTLEDPALTPTHPIRKAINYAVERRECLEVFLDDPLVPIDTNDVECALRRIKLGQKNWLFSWTETGAHNVGIVNSLIATCQLHGISPLVYLVDILQRIDTHPADRIHELTPRLWKELFADAPMTGGIVLSGVWTHPDTARGPP